MTDSEKLTIAIAALRECRSLWFRGGRDPVTGFIDWQRSLDRVERIATKALAEIVSSDMEETQT